MARAQLLCDGLPSPRDAQHENTGHSAGEVQEQRMEVQSLRARQLYFGYFIVQEKAKSTFGDSAACRLLQNPPHLTVSVELSILCLFARIPRMNYYAWL